MPHFQWPIARQKKKTFEDQMMEKEMRTEAGLTEIKGTNFLKYRVEGSDEGITEIIQIKIRQLNALGKRKTSKEIEEKIDLLQKEITLWTFYKQFKRASAPWAAAGEDRDMSQRLRSTEILFFRNLENPAMWKMLMMVLQYVTDVCYKEIHSRVPPTLIIQTPVMKGYGQQIALGTESQVPET